MIPKPYQNERNSFDDSQRWKAFQEGDAEAFEFLYQQHIQTLYDYGMYLYTNPDLVKDAIQELFIYIWQRRNSLGEVKNTRNYLMVSLRRCIIEHQEMHKKWHIPVLEKVNYLSEVEASPESCLIANEGLVRQEQDLMKAIEALSPRQREVIYLLFFKKIPQKEVATLMSINLASVYTLTSKAIKSLKKQLK